MLKWALIAAGICGGLLFVMIIVLAFASKDSQTTPAPISVDAGVGVTVYMSEPVNLDPDKGLISGRLCETVVGDIDQMLLVAEHIPSRVTAEKFYPGLAKAQSDLYYFELDPGVYEIYSKKLDGTRWGLYSEYVQCGLGSDCVDHKMIQLNVIAGQEINNIDICDYQWSRGV